MSMTAEQLQKDHPEVFNQVKKLGEDVAGINIDERIETARTKAASAERQRIMDVAAQSLPGHEDLIKELMFDGKTTGPEAAAKIVEAEKKNRARAKSDFLDDGKNNVPGAEVNAEAEAKKLKAKKKKDPDKKPLDEKAKEVWDNDPELRAEFGDSDEGFQSYLAYEKAMDSGNAKVLGGAH